MSTASAVQVPVVAGTVQALIDNNTVVTAAGTVQRQVVTLGDATTPGNYAKVDADGVLETGGAALTPTETNPAMAGASAPVLAANAAANYRFIQNPSSVPVRLNLAGGTALTNRGMLLGPFGGYEMSKQNGNLIRGAINGISQDGSTSTTLYCLEG